MSEVNVAGVVVLLVFYLFILVVGIVAARRKKSAGQDGNEQSLQSSIVAGRDIGVLVGVFTMTATTVGGGYINGTAEVIATAGLFWTLAPFGIFFGLTIGGLVFAGRMRRQKYLTMLDPFQEVYGSVSVFLVYIATLWGDLFWTASILTALGTSLSVIINLSRTAAIISSALVTIMYTMAGQMISVAYTDIVQLLLITGGLTLSVPFVLTNEKAGDIMKTTDVWIGQYDEGSTSVWIDLFIAMTFGTIPWQAYFQRVLSVRTARQAQILSVVGGLSALVLVIPSILIGAVAVSADWTNTTLGMSPMAANKSDMVLPYVVNEFTPTPVSILGLCAISAAVMSSMDSSILGSSSMFTHNIYQQLFRPHASNTELLWVQRLAVFVIGALATVVSLSVEGVYGLFILAADVVFVIVLPQLIGAVFLRWTNIYGSVCGFLLGTILRVGAGESSINLPPFIAYPYFDKNHGQLFPFRTFAMVVSLVTIMLISLLMKFLIPKMKQVYHRKSKVCRPGKFNENREDGFTNCREDRSEDEISRMCDFTGIEHGNCGSGIKSGDNIDCFIHPTDKKNVFRNCPSTEEGADIGGQGDQLLRNKSYCEDEDSISVQQDQTTVRMSEIDTTLPCALAS